MRFQSPFNTIAMLVILSSLLVACSDDSQSPQPSATDQQAVAPMAAESEVQEQAEAIDESKYICRDKNLMKVGVFEHDGKIGAICSRKEPQPIRNNLCEKQGIGIHENYCVTEWAAQGKFFRARELARKPMASEMKDM